MPPTTLNSEEPLFRGSVEERADHKQRVLHVIPQPISCFPKFFCGISTSKEITSKAAEENYVRS